MIKAVLFDLDDTLIWDEKSIAEAFRDTCKIVEKDYHIDTSLLEKKVQENARSLYASYDTYEFTEDIGISPFEMLWGNFYDEGYWFKKLQSIAPYYRKAAWTNGLKELGIDDEQLGNKLAETFPVMRKKMPYVYDDTFAVLDQLKEKYQLIMLTNGSPDLQQTKLDLTPELAPYFNHIVVSGAFGKGKPDPSIFTYALEHMGVNSDEAIMVGDNQMTDILGASKSGIDSIWLNHHGREQKVEPTYEIKELTELLSII